MREVGVGTRGRERDVLSGKGEQPRRLENVGGGLWRSACELVAKS